MQASEDVEKIGRMVFRQIVVACNQDDQTIKFSELFDAIQQKKDMGLALDKSVEVQKFVRTKDDLVKLLKFMESKNKVLYTEKMDSIVLI
jgi:hypothetical protein